MRISKEAKTGFVAVLAIALFIWGYNYLKGINIFKPTREYYVVYDKIDGLIESGNVILKGYKVGTVTSIKFDHKQSGKLIVKLSLEEHVNIPKYSVAQITSSSPIAPAKDIRLVLSDASEYLSPGDTLLPGFDEGISGILDQISDKAEELMEELNTTLTAVNSALTPEAVAGIKGTIYNLESTTKQLKQQMQGGGELNTSLENIEEITTTLKNNNDKITGIINNVYSISDSLNKADLKTTLENAGRALDHTQSIMAVMQSGEGSVGQLLYNDSLYKNLTHATASLDSLLTDLKTHPKKYVHFSVFGKKEK